VFIVKLRQSEGNFVWAKRLGAAPSSHGDMGITIAADRDGHVFVVGHVYIGTATSASDGPRLFKLDGSDGRLIWHRSLSSQSLDVVRAMRVDAAGEVVLVGAVNANDEEISQWSSGDVDGTRTHAVAMRL
jgi:outer membrane protein assembly factor BamB